ncbi:TonB-dependent receptor [Pseudoalteromonas ruthenica]|uniref:TonB-dependent receptor n=1 Tax=Pseudoalteromonas ruthenica TaxID=151081 RepID=A0A0F4PI34_9GAMM|nr:TonB-dependent receptor [Pseudoalteromonas ruthenica]KJY94688.1 TonB-dependent receptor [Pseudoalteromonas ruthenica]KJY98597.1 TonB-dependent receptor [Pseudoalteromonas ruthenica]TMO90001.1 TonB-dependent receptor [Pseudoalteromonas ruthenica]TMO91323.1 TonB-dependent receptor [Pseudoalteromonas ruthenica]TMO98010.1 TonB-dependent receptor [Pseudoalteromonas ruthenica]
MNARLCLLACAVAQSLSLSAHADESDIEKIIVTGDFKNESIQELSASASLFSEADIASREAKYLDELLNQAANVNFTAGASRGKFVQIRGIGLRSQFVDPVNPSVGVVIDGINYSGLGGAAMLFDVDQVEIYRGPQGTRFGADALAGMIHMESAEPTLEPSVKVKLGAGNYNAWDAGIAAGTGFGEKSSVRASFYQNKSDGYVDNQYLDSNSQNIDEQVARIKLHSQITEHWRTELVAHYMDIDNGYDAFTLDNTRISVADEPGKDTQESVAVGLSNIYSGFNFADVQFNLTGLDADLLYSYDEDWVCNDPEQPALCLEGLHPYAYSSTDSYQRDRQDYTAELQLSGKAGNWVSGLYYQSRDVDLLRQYTWNAGDFTSTYDSENIALYGQIETPISDKTRLVTGLRVERNEGQYSDSAAVVENVDDTMVGAKVALEYQVVPRTMIYTSISRGYKAGGINAEAIAKANDEGLSQDADFFLNHRTFDPEYLWNAEFGVKGSSADKRLNLRITAFYMYRDNIQLKAWKTEDQQFAGYFDNGNSGENYGLEIEGEYAVSKRLTLTGSVGALDSEIDGFVTAEGVDQSDRDQAQAPHYQYALNARFDITDALFVNLGVEGKDEYYFSNSHNSKSPSYNLVNASVGYQAEYWGVNFWVRNALDKDYYNRGFKFGNNPVNGYIAQTYVQYAEPRVAGVSFNYGF